MKAFKAFSKTKTDKGYVHGYDRYYDEIFKDYTPTSLLEIGIKKGNSLAAWKLMFPKCDLWGLDITDKEFSPRVINFCQANVVISDSTKFETLEKLRTDYDIIIDDGSHYYKDIMKTFLNMHNLFNKYYIIEDWPYDLGIAKKFLNKHGYNNISFHISDRSRMVIEERLIFRTKSKKLIKINQNMIIIKR